MAEVHLYKPFFVYNTPGFDKTCGVSVPCVRQRRLHCQLHFVFCLMFSFGWLASYVGQSEVPASITTVL